MSNKLLYGLLGALGLGAIGTVIYNNTLEDEPVTDVEQDAGAKVDDDQKEDQTKDQTKYQTEDLEEDQTEDLEEDQTEYQDQTSETMSNLNLSEIFQIEFEDPDHIISKKEKKSKLLKKSSSLYSVLYVYRNKLLEAYGEDVSDQRMDFHIEVVKKSEEWTEDKLLDRAKELDGRCIDLADTDMWNIGRHSVTIKTGRVMGYGNTHITLAYFKNGVPEDVEDVLFEIDDRTTDFNDINNGEEEV